MTRRYWTERERDARDLKILTMLDNGMTQEAARFNMTRGSIAKMVREIRADEKQNETP